MKYITKKIRETLNSHGAYYLAVLFGGFLWAFNSAEAGCLDCEYQQADMLPNIIRENDQMVKVLILILSLLLLIYGIYKAYSSRSPISRDGNLFPVMIDLIKFIPFILFKIFLLYLITYIFSGISYFVSSILATIVMSFYNSLNHSLDGHQYMFYREEFKYLWLAIYSFMAYNYAVLLLRRNEKLNLWIIAAVTFFVFAMVYMVIPSTIVGYF